MVNCISPDCGENAVISVRQPLCKGHFSEDFEKRVAATIKKYKLIGKKDKVIVACSGGKDSTTVLYLLNKWFGNVTALAIDEGIPGYRNVTLEDLRSFCSRNAIPLKTVSYKEAFGFTLHEALRKITVLPCNVCGTLRRYLLNTAARGFTKIATGHNLDDEAQSIMMNFFKCSLELAARLGPARWDPETGAVDYNRSGYPLVEIVTKPDFKSAEEVRQWLRRLVTTLSYIKAISPDLGIKSDVNVSVAPDFGRVEIKNVNSFRSIVRALEYEAARQQREVKEGRKVARETRAWNDAKGLSIFMRQKETAVDYMFIPDPDLPAVKVTAAEVRKIAGKLPEKPAAKIKKYVQKWKIDHVDAEVLSSEILLAELFEKVAAVINPVLAARWLRRELLRVLNYNKKELEEVKIDEKHIIQLLKLVESRRITDEVAKNILEKLVERQFDVEEYVRKNNLFAVAKADVLEKYCEEAIAENPQAVADYKNGKEKALNFIVGFVMQKSRGKATPQQVSEILKRMID